MFPYFFSLKKNNATLFYLGVRHSWNPTDKQFNIIKQKWLDFLKIAKHPLAVVESRGWKIYNTEKEAISKGGEIDFMAYLCHQANVPISCFEPDRGSEINALLQQFPKEQIAYYYFARAISQWYRLTQKPDINSYLLPFLQRDKKASGWNDFEFSLENMKNVHRQLFNTELDFNNVEFFSKIENPTREDNPLKDVVRASGKYRDQTTTDSIKNTWNQGYNLFIIYGEGHARNHEKILLEYQSKK
ncbi:MAG: hypothetical protein AAB958_01795 [Patescibacteria group bacterium]